MPPAFTCTKSRSSEQRVASIADVYGGKICAALDRQHPRDLFDINDLLITGISDDIRRAFLVYLASHNRPMHELLQPNYLDVRHLYEEEFLGMSRTELSYEILIGVECNWYDTTKQVVEARRQQTLYFLNFEMKKIKVIHQ